MISFLKNKYGLIGLALSGLAVTPVAILELQKRRAIEQIVKDKLSVYFGDDSRKSYKNLYTKFYAPYSFSNLELTGTAIEKYLKSCAKYNGESLNFVFVGDSEEACYLGDRCVDPLKNASIDWRKKELLDGDYGFFSKNALQIEENTRRLPQELRDQISYFVKALEINLYLMRKYSQTSEAKHVNKVDELYQGPLAWEKIEPNGAIGSDSYSGIIKSVVTGWGSFDVINIFRIDNLLPEVFQEAKKTLNLKRFNALPEIDMIRYSVTKSIDGEEIPEIEDCDFSCKERSEIYEKWEKIRDPVFLTLQRTHKNNAVQTRSAKEMIIHNVNSIYNSAGVVYGSIPNRFSLSMQKLRLKFKSE